MMNKPVDTDREPEQAMPASLDAVIQRGITESDAGRGKPCAEVFDRLEAKYRAMVLAKGGDSA